MVIICGLKDPSARFFVNGTFQTHELHLVPPFVPPSSRPQSLSTSPLCCSPYTPSPPLAPDHSPFFPIQAIEATPCGYYCQSITGIPLPALSVSARSSSQHSIILQIHRRLPGLAKDSKDAPAALIGPSHPDVPSAMNHSSYKASTS